MSESVVMELAGVAEVLREANLVGAGAWRSCSGCHETNEGAETGHYPYSAALDCFLGAGCHECGGIGAVWEYWSEADLAAMAAQAQKPTISAWLPEQDRIRLAILGKLIEECNELAARAARCIIHGLDEVDPDSGRTNFIELGREIADVDACISVATSELSIPVSSQRTLDKTAGFERWHGMIREAADA